ncbi:hypothetical protein PoB_006292200 [Plakobranchus ocellatus]|uniref:Uncharacterized protein n=1 Tax=Plakobranchus ocellatus TaxID=259542 RepID=A0AAV4CWY7_9GAST|nr:hypothetical protein PoB_006292200 [Plakobranchus ocellatus]
MLDMMTAVIPASLISEAHLSHHFAAHHQHTAAPHQVMAPPPTLGHALTHTSHPPPVSQPSSSNSVLPMKTNNKRILCDLRLSGPPLGQGDGSGARTLTEGFLQIPGRVHYLLYHQCRQQKENPLSQTPEIKG